jgi:5-methylthioadenosine/S-adenosylhomocysteine deaminase
MTTMQTMIHNTTIVTADDTCAVHYDAAIVVEADRIAAIGPTAELLARYPAAERIDGRGKAVMPGFANTHTHLAMTLARGIYEDLSPSHTPPFVGGLAPLPLPQLSTEEHQVMCQLGVVEAIRSGTTLVLEDAVGIQRYAEALAESGLRFLLCERAWDRARAAIGQPGPFETDSALAEQGLTRIEALHSRWHGRANGRIAVGLAAWAPGNKADLIIIDLRRPHLVPLLRVVSCFVHQGQAHDVEALMVDGRWLMRDRVLLTMDEAAIVQEADRIGRAAWQRLFTERPTLTPPSGFHPGGIT